MKHTSINAAPPSITTTTPPQSVAILVHDLEFMGETRALVELAAALNTDKARVALWVLAAPGDLSPLAAAQGLEVHRLGRTRRVTPLVLVRLCKLLRARRPDAVLLYGGAANIWGRILGRIAGVPRIFGTLRAPGDAWRQLEPLLWPLATRLLVNAEALKQEARRFFIRSARMTRVRDGVDCQRFYPETADMRDPAPRILCLGRLKRGYGHDILFRAFAKVVDAHPQARLMVVGNGSLSQKLLRTAQRLGIAGNTEFLPARQDISPLFHVAHVVAIPAINADVWASLLEAMASGLPVVAADACGVGEVVAQRETGVLTPPGDVESLARALNELLADAPLRARMGAAGRERAARDYNLQDVAGAYAALLESS